VVVICSVVNAQLTLQCPPRRVLRSGMLEPRVLTGVGHSKRLYRDKGSARGGDLYKGTEMELELGSEECALLRA
jgi:hypothetical protein